MLMLWTYLFFKMLDKCFKVLKYWIINSVLLITRILRLHLLHVSIIILIEKVYIWIAFSLSAVISLSAVSSRQWAFYKCLSLPVQSRTWQFYAQYPYVKKYIYGPKNTTNVLSRYPEGKIKMRFRRVSFFLWQCMLIFINKK